MMHCKQKSKASSIDEVNVKFKGQNKKWVVIYIYVKDIQNYSKFERYP